jgi:alpha,alpha-trehalase
MEIDLRVEDTFLRLLEQEDTDGDKQITVRDRGPKHFELVGEAGGSVAIEGTYALSNLLQELAIAREAGLSTFTLSLERLRENPVRRISRMIREIFWDGLTRTVDADGLARTVVDTKGEGTGLDRGARVYVPHTDARAFEYFQHVAAAQPELGLEVLRLPDRVTPEYVRGLNEKPGVLSLKLVRREDGGLEGAPFVVPGGRFNELYGWDSYFEALGLLIDGRLDLAVPMVEHFAYEIEHYGRILNANRSYYLTRSQPPFLTAMGRAVYGHLPPGAARDRWIGEVITWAIREYETVWTAPPRLTPTGLSRYYGEGIGMPPETEESHYDGYLRPYAAAAGMDVKDYATGVRRREISEEELDAYFVHDRTLRESGHDNSYRLEGCAADLCTIDLNSLLYRYEVDIGRTIETVFGGEIEMPDQTVHTAENWLERARERRALVNDLCWDESAGMFFDYDVKRGHRTGFESVTTFYALWSGLASEAQAAAMVARGLPLFEAAGGLTSTSERSRGPISADRPQRQWDYPFGWPPHQILTWQGLRDYGFERDAQRLAYRWLLMITENARDYNGTIPEKYDVVRRTHDVFVEYGNVGTDFDYITREGFGWMNASYQIGLTMLTPAQREALESFEPTDTVFGSSM